MSNRREQIRMSDAEMWDFIEQQKSLQVGTLMADGSIHLSTLWFAMINQDSGDQGSEKRLVFETYTKSQKILNLQRDPRITCLVEDGTEYNTLRGAMLKGTAELVTGDAVHAMALEVMVRNTPGIDRETLSQAAEHMARKRTAVIVHPTSIVT